MKKTKNTPKRRLLNGRKTVRELLTQKYVFPFKHLTNALGVRGQIARPNSVFPVQTRPNSDKPLVVKMMTAQEVKKMKKRGAFVKVLGRASTLDFTSAIQKAIEIAPARSIGVKIHGVDAARFKDAPTAIHVASLACTIDGGGAAIPSGGIAGGGHGFSRGGDGYRSSRRGGGAGRHVRCLGNRKKLEEELYIVLVDIDKLKKRVKEILEMLDEPSDNNDGNNPPPCHIFRKEIDEEKMADAFYEVYDLLFGCKREEMLDSDYKKEIDLIVYLFILVDKNKLGRDDFHNNSVKPFFEFVKSNVFQNVQIKGTRETLNNRIKHNMTDLYLSQEQRNMLPGALLKRAEALERDYQKVCGNFHKTDYYKELWNLGFQVR